MNLDSIQSQLAELRETTKTITTTLDKLAGQIETAKAAPKEEDFKVGDLVVRTENPYNMPVVGNVYRIQSLDDDDNYISICHEENGKSSSLRMKRFYRKADFAADRAQVDRYLLLEAELQGFKKGARMIVNGKGYGQIIDRITVVHVNEKSSGSVQEAIAKTGQPVVAVYYGHDGFYSAPTSKCSVVKEEDITITVEGREYTADFSQPGIVRFGCAEIARATIKHAYEFLKSELATDDKPGNRQVTAVQIGKGLFTTDLLGRLLARLAEKK